MKTLLAAFVTLTLVLPSTADARNFRVCQLQDGRILAKKKCNARKGEVELSIHSVAVAGAPGPQGPQGPRGPQGVQGPRGESAFEVLPPGTRIIGRMAREASQTTNFFEIESTTSEMFGRAGRPIPNSSLVLKINSAVQSACPVLSDCIEPVTLSNSLSKQNLCPGTAELPAAAPGIVCVYPFAFSNIWHFRLASGGNGVLFADWLLDGQVANGATYLDATWAYVEPNTSATTAQSGTGDGYQPINPRKK